MLCPKCGAPLEENSKFCVSCGAEVANAEPVENTPQENPTVDANAEPQKEATSEKKVSVEPKKKKSNLGSWNASHLDRSLSHFDCGDQHFPHFFWWRFLHLYLPGNRRHI
mgnify:CR=1 FL=1